MKGTETKPVSSPPREKPDKLENQYQSLRFAQAPDGRIL
jgi:hypothetical protein